MQQMNILIKLPNWLGDCIMLSPTIAFIHRIYPHAKITLIGNKLAASVFKENDFIVKIFVDNTKDSKLKKNFISKFFHRLKATKILAFEINCYLKENGIKEFDYAITTQNNFFSALLLSKIYAKYTIGYDDKNIFGLRKFLLTTLVKYKNHNAPIAPHEVLSYINLTLPLLQVSFFKTFIEKNGGKEYMAKFINSPCYNKNATLTQNILYTQARELTLFRELPKADSIESKIIAITPGAAFGSSKMWLSQYFVEIICEFIKMGYKVRIFGTASEATLNADITQSVLRILGSEFDKFIENLSGKTSIETLITSLNECALFIGNDSGVAHIARALRLPSIVIFGPMPFLRCAPWQPIDLDSMVSNNAIKIGESYYIDNYIAIQKDLECVPCKKKTCPLKHHNCMRLITPDLILHHAKKLLKNRI